MNFMRLKHWLVYCVYVILILRNYNLWVKSGRVTYIQNVLELLLLHTATAKTKYSKREFNHRL